jgi:hypothetical protein
MAELPIGSIIMFDGVTPPVGWYDCDGGSYAGVQTPNLVGAFPLGVPASGGSLGAAGGASTHTHTNLSTGNATHGHAAASGNSGSASGQAVNNIWSGAATGLAGHNHLLSVGAVTGAESHNHTVPNTDAATSMPPYIRLRYIMRCE